MIYAPTVANVCVIAGLLLLLLTPIDSLADPSTTVATPLATPAATSVATPVAAKAAKTTAKTAAEIDWIPAANLTPTQRAKLPWYCSGEYREPPPATGITPGYVQATANKSTYNADKGTELYGDVHVAQQYRRIKSPHVKLDSTRNIATVDGPLIVREKGLTLTGDHATFDLSNGTGLVDRATFLLHLPRLRGQAKSIQRVESTDLIVTDGSFTRCDPGSNAWSLHGKYIRLEPRTGFGTAKNVTIDIKGVPILYVPYLRFPIDNKRHTGFLMPSFGYEHVGGVDVTLPYYVNIAPEYDLTWEPRSLWKRGLINTVQFRFLAGASTNKINLAYLNKDNLYDDRSLIDQTTSGVNTTGANVPTFVKKDRWLLNIAHTGGWNSRWKSSIDYSAVSDIDYLHDIGGDLGSGSVNQFVNSVDQNLTSQRSAALNRLGKISYRGDKWNSSLTLQGFQNLVAGAAEQYEALPQFNSVYSNRFGPINTALTFQYSNFDKDTTGITGPLAILGQREVVDAAVSIRKGVGWGYIEPKLDIIHRVYQLRNTPAGVDTNPSLTTPRLSLDAGLYFDRSFNFYGHLLQQTLEPRIYYLYVKDNDQSELPGFDASPLTPSYNQLFRNNRYNGWDRIGDARQVSLGVTTRFLNADTGAQYLQTSIGQIYYLKDRKVVYQPGPVYNPTTSTSPLFWQARLSLPDGLNVSGSYEWDPSADRSNRANFSLHYSSGERRIFNLSYIYTNPLVQPVGQFQTTKQSDVSIIWPIKDRWSVIGRWNFGLDLHQTIESIVGVEYNNCCWQTRVVLRRFLKAPETVTRLQDDPNSPTGYTAVTGTIVPHDTGIFIEFQLKGLATLGRRLDLLLQEAIPGYSAREEKIGN